MNDTKTSSMHYTVFPSPLGWILLASTAKGICLLHLCGPEPLPDNKIRNRLLDYYPGSVVEPGEHLPLLREAREAVLRYLTEGSPLPAFPLDTGKGTEFQQEVWRALCRIPFGETRSYIEIARAIGRPRSARAVGQACGRNPIALIVPCHRVVAHGGGLGGYSGGLNIKAALMKLEARETAGGTKAIPLTSHTDRA